PCHLRREPWRLGYVELLPRIRVHPPRRPATWQFGGLFPFNGGWRLGTDVVDHPVYPGNLVHDAVGDGGQHLIGQRGPIGRHAVFRLHRANGAGESIGAQIAHYAHRPHRQEHGEGLPQPSVQPGALDLLHRNRIGLLHESNFLGGDLAQNPDRQAWTGERLALEQLRAEIKIGAHLADLVFEQLAQRLEQLQTHLGGEAADVVVALDDRGRPFDRHRFNDVGVERSLHQEVRLERRRRLFEDFNEDLADDLSLLFRIGNALQRPQELGPGIHGQQVQTELIAHRPLHFYEFIFAQQSVVDEHAGQAIADGPVYQGGGNAGIHAPAQAADRSSLLPHLVPDPRHLILDQRT